MADVSTGDTADITLTDSASLTAKVDIDENSLLARAGFKQIVSHTTAFVAKLDRPVDQSGFKTGSFGAKFSAPSLLIAKGTKVTVKSDVSGGFSVFTHDDGKLFGDDFTPEVPIAEDQCWMSFEIDATVDGKLAATVDGVGVALEGTTAACFTTYSLLKAQNGRFPALKDAMRAALQNYSVSCSAGAIRAQRPGTVNVSDLKGTIKVSGSYSVPINVSALASASLPFNYSIDVNPGGTVQVSGSIALTGQFVVRSHRVSDTELRLGVYKKKGTTFTASLTAGAGLGVDAADTDLMGKVLGAVFPGVDLQKAGITGKQAKSLEDAVGDCVDHSLSLSMNASCSASLTDEAAVAYSIDLSAANAQETDAAIASALRGDWTSLAALPNAKPVRNIFRETEKAEHKIVINLLGIYNAETVNQFVKTCTILHDADGQVLITDKATASQVAVASVPFLANADKLRSALAEGFLATAAYVAGGSGSPGGTKLKEFSAAQNYFRFQDKVSAHDMRQQIVLGKALQLIADGSWDKLLASQNTFGHAKISATATYDTAAAMKLFFKDPSQRAARPLAELESIGRQVMIAFIDPSDATGPARIRVLNDDATWNAMDQTGAVASFGALDGLKHLSPNELADVGVDWSDIRWWADAMVKVAPKLSDMLAALEQSKNPDPSKDRKFMAARAALAGMLGQVTRHSRAAFAGGWGIAVMEQVSGFAAPASLDIAADGGIKQHYESGSQAVQCSA
ncbi:MAG: hypothetical protein P4M04_07885 [Acidobacteriota bacterium]|nr:hypothetical protein [Acidobacteriota bacterium]